MTPNPKMKIWADAADNIKDAPDWFRLASKNSPRMLMMNGYD